MANRVETVLADANVKLASVASGVLALSKRECTKKVVALSSEFGKMG